MDFYEIIKSMEEGDCDCGFCHRARTRKININSGTVTRVGEILHDADFPSKILIVTDRNSLPFALLCEKSMGGFDFALTVLDADEIATSENISAILREFGNDFGGILAVGDGGLVDTSRVAAFNLDAPFCNFSIFPTGFEFMCGYSDYMSDGKLLRASAKAPNILIADTDIISAVPKEKRAEAFSSLALVYPTLIDARTNALLKNTSFCYKAEAMLRFAVDSAFDKAYAFDGDFDGNELEEATEALTDSIVIAGLIFGMIDFDVSDGCASNYARFLKKIGALSESNHSYTSLKGVCALHVLKFYGDLLILFALKGQDDPGLEGKLRELCGDFYTLCPDLDKVEPAEVEAKWEAVRDIIGDMPTYDEIKDKFTFAGLLTSTDEIGIDAVLAENAFICAPYTSDVLTLARMLKMVDFTKIYRSLEEIKESETEANDGVEINLPK